MNLTLYAVAAIFLYFFALVAISRYRSKAATMSDYLVGGKNSTWWLITIGMISDSLSGVTYVSVPGAVSTQQYSYLQLIFGQFFGYLVIAFILLPLYYRMNLVSIYSYLGKRFGPVSEKTGALFFIVSRIFGSAARLYIAVMVLHHFFFSDGSLSPIVSFVFAMALIVLYTYKGGIKSLVWTDAFQSLFLLAGVFAVYGILWNSLPNALDVVFQPQLFFWDPLPKNFFFKQFIGGAFIAIAMSGLDQNIMQKNLSCKTSGEASKNMAWYGVVSVLVNLFFVSLGQLAISAYSHYGLTPGAADQILPTLVFGHLGTIASLFFILGLTAATFSSADSVLPSLASSIEIDLLPKKHKISIRMLHLLVAILILLLIIALYLAKTESLIGVILRYAGYTYGPLLGIFSIGILTKWKLNEKWVPVCAIAACLTTAVLDQNSARYFGGYQIGIELMVVNALIFILFACLIRKKQAARS